MKGNGLLILIIILIAFFVIYKDKRAEGFSCASCGGPSYVHIPWRTTADGECVKYP